MAMIGSSGFFTASPSLKPPGEGTNIFDVLPKIGETAIRIIQAVRGEQIQPIPFEVGLAPDIQQAVQQTIRVSTSLLVLGGIVLFIAFSARRGGRRR